MLNTALPAKIGTKFHVPIFTVLCRLGYNFSTNDSITESDEPLLSPKMCFALGSDDWKLKDGKNRDEQNSPDLLIDSS